MDKNFFIKPTHIKQKQYEVLRASFVDNLSDQQSAEKFGYAYYTFKSLKRDCKNASAEDFFKPVIKGRQQGREEKTMPAKDIVIALRKRNYSNREIREYLLTRNKIDISETIINDILTKEGFTKLFRRTFRERLEALQEEKDYPDKSDIQEFGTVPQVSTSFGGIFLFIPLLLDLNVQRLFDLKFYESKGIPRLNYLLSYLAVKLLGVERLSHVQDYSFDYGLGVFAGLNVLPKSSALSSYSYRHSTSLITTLLKGFCKILHQNHYITGKNINLDFHSIPYYGEREEIENNWIPTRGKRMSSILSFFAQDLDTTFLCYSNGDIAHNEQNDEILKFVEFYKQTTGLLPQRLIFDSKLTTYNNLNKLNEQGISFITLGRRGKKIVKDMESIKDWKKVTLDNTERKYRELEYAEQKVKIRDYRTEIRELYVRGNGRELPMRLFTNDFTDTSKNIITCYTKRWRIENNIQENIDFFNLNALQSSVIVQVNFDIAMTLIANTLYKLLAQNTKWFNDAKPKTISRNFVNIQTTVVIDENEIKVCFDKSSYIPVLKDWIETLPTYQVPWWNDKKLKFVFK
ncbi:MAG: transposase [Proteobacteria bacterium]|nr:transposase [Pseudomonadota bacterium]